METSSDSLRIAFFPIDGLFLSSVIRFASILSQIMSLMLLQFRTGRSDGAMRSYVLTPLKVMLIRGYIVTWVAITQCFCLRASSRLVSPRGEIHFSVFSRFTSVNVCVHTFTFRLWNLFQRIFCALPHNGLSRLVSCHLCASNREAFHLLVQMA